MMHTFVIGKGFRPYCYLRSLVFRLCDAAELHYHYFEFESKYNVVDNLFMHKGIEVPNVKLLFERKLFRH